MIGMAPSCLYKGSFARSGFSVTSRLKMKPGVAVSLFIQLKNQSYDEVRVVSNSTRCFNCSSSSCLFLISS